MSNSDFPWNTEQGEQGEGEQGEIEFVFDYEIGLYRKDPAAYKATTPPAFLVKLLAVSEERRIQQEAANAIKRKHPDKMTTAELENAIFEALGLPRTEDAK